MTTSIIEYTIKLQILDDRGYERRQDPHIKEGWHGELTEQMFYVLLCLDEECCGTDILDRVPSMTGGRVTVGSGTLYNLLEQFSEAGMIRETKVVGRRRSYLLTDAGRERLGREYERICAQARDYQEIFGNRKAEREVLDTGWEGPMTGKEALA